MSDTPTNTQHPADLAINLQHECVRMKLRREFLRAQASELRKQAKAIKIKKAAASSMRAEAKTMSDEAQVLRVKLGKAGQSSHSVSGPYRRSTHTADQAHA